jgi:hypothetical protein
MRDRKESGKVKGESGGTSEKLKKNEKGKRR